jgi:O-antigen/teichoic acid export membrane protein
MSRLARNILYNLAGQTFVLVVGFVAVRFVYRQLGDDAVGIIFFALTLNNVVAATMDLGISSTIVREVAARATSPPGHTQALLRTAGMFYWTIYAVLGVAVAFAAEPIAQRWLNLRTLDPATAAQSLRILGAGTFLALPRSLYASLFKGLQRMGVTNAIDAAFMGIQQAGIVATIAAGGSIVAVSWWIAASTAAGVGSYIVAASRVVPPRTLLPYLDLEVIRRNRGFASQMTVLSVLALIHVHTDKLIVSRLLPLGTFGLYAFGSNAVNRGMLLTAGVTQAAFPSLSELHRLGDRRGLLNQYRRLHDTVCYTAPIIFAVAPFAILPVFRVLFGPTEAEAMLLPTTLLALGFYMNSTLNMPWVVSLAIGRPAIALSLNAWALVVVLPITVLLVRGWGLDGAALSWVVYHVFAYVYFVPRVCRECLDGRVGWWYGNVAKFLIPAIAVYTVAWFAAIRLARGSELSLAVGYVGGTALYSIIGWRALPPDVRDRLLSVLVRTTAEPPSPLQEG